MIKLQASAEIGAKAASKDAGWTPEAVQHTAFFLGRKGKSFSRPTSEDDIQGSDSMVKNLDCLHQAIGGTLQRGRILVEIEQAIFGDSKGWMTMRESGEEMLGQLKLVL